MYVSNKRFLFITIIIVFLQLNSYLIDYNLILFAIYMRYISVIILTQLKRSIAFKCESVKSSRSLDLFNFIIKNNCSHE